ncbi:MAG: hypothetical protein IKP62_02120 [Salinivirgaceae bacterium]|nr:hypothetical protein [Salinivirgaceae bacterium]
MNECIPNYIVPIYQSDKFIGTGFIVDDTLFTAQHVGLGQYGGGQYVKALVNGKKYSLLTFAALFSYGDIDTIAFRLADMDFESPLHFADTEPVYDSGKGEPVLYQSKHFQPLEDGRFMYRETDCFVKGKMFDKQWHFDGFNFDHTVGGASGSPLIKDNLVYGMLVKGLDITVENAELEKKELMEVCGLTEKQAETCIQTNCLTNIYVKGCIIKQVYERDLKNKPEKKILSLNNMFV